MPSLKSKSTTAKKKKGKASINGIKTQVTPEHRYQMISEAAYFRAEKRGFVAGDAAEDWLVSEAEIDRILQQGSETCKESLITKKAFQKQLELQLKKWDGKFDKLQVKAKKAKAEIRDDIENQIESLVRKRAAAQTKMLEFGHRTEDAWEDLKGGAEKTWNELHEALNHFISRFK